MSRRGGCFFRANSPNLSTANSERSWRLRVRGYLPTFVNRQAAAMDEWHRNGVGKQLREIRAPALIAAGTEDIVIPPSNALKLVNAIPSAWLAQFPRGGHAFMAQYPRPLADLINGFLPLG
jgi:pimeloyl-ACP methyl ester carboxylesterase